MPIGYTADASTHCERHTVALYGSTEGVDREGNPIGAVFSWDEGASDFYCDECLYDIVSGVKSELVSAFGGLL